MTEWTPDKTVAWKREAVDATQPCILARRLLAALTELERLQKLTCPGAEEWHKEVDRLQGLATAAVENSDRKTAVNDKLNEKLELEAEITGLIGNLICDPDGGLYDSIDKLTDANAALRGKVEAWAEARERYKNDNNCYPDNDCYADCCECAREDFTEACKALAALAEKKDLTVTERIERDMIARDQAAAEQKENEDG